MTKILVKKANDKVINLALTDTTGDPLDVTGYVFTFWLSKLGYPSTKQFTKAGVITDATGGTVSISLTDTELNLDSGERNYYIHMVTDSGNDYTIIGGIFDIDERYTDESQTTSFTTTFNADTTINISASLGAAADEFVNLTDTPSTYVGQGGKFVKVNVAEDALEFSTSSATVAWNELTGTQSDVNLSGFTNDSGFVTDLSAFDTDDLAEGDNKFVTATDITNLSNLSGTNSGDQDLSGYLTISTAASTYEPLKGADDNFVTDAQLVVIGNTSGTNTGDQDLSSYALISQLHNAVTVTDSSEIDFTLTGQDITASIKSGSIDESKLDTSVNASLGLADSALQSFTETDPVYLASQAANITATDITNLSNLSGTNTGDQDLSGLATKANVLELDNTTSFTPDADYEPATKKYVDDNSGSGISSIVEDTTPQLGGNLDWNAKGNILASQTVGGSDGNLVYLSGSATWSQADASAEATCSKMLAIRVSATVVLTHGIYTTTGLTAGAIYYASETAGAITTTAPTTSAAIVRPIGYALSTTQLFVDPDKTWVELA